MPETLKIQESEKGIEKEMIHDSTQENENSEKAPDTNKNDTTKNQMAAELKKMGLTPQAIRRLLNLKNW